jgi:hypothetical protein
VKPARASKETHPAASRAGTIAAALFLVICLFQIGLAIGLPWGEAAFGGANTGVLPAELRVSSAIAAVVYGALAVVAGTRLAPAPIRRVVLYGAAGLMAVGVLANIASPSFVERIIWAPVTIVLTMCLWNAARHPSLNSRTRPATV